MRGFCFLSEAFWELLHLFNLFYFLIFFFPFLLYSHDTTIQIYRCKEIRSTDDSPLFRYETFIYFLTFSFSTRGERDTIFTMLTVPTSPTVNPPRLDWSGPESNLNSLLFRNHQKSRPITSGHNVIHTPVIFPIWGFYYDICDCHILGA